jgi:hypothetical protein
MTLKNNILALASAALLCACGGGGGGTTAGSTAPTGGGSSGGTSGIQGSGIALGSITGFGSIFVNGVEWRTTSAQFTIDGQSGGREDQLRVGKVVTVRGTLDASGTTGSATTVDYSDSLEGPVSAKNVAAGTLLVLGQTVRITASTRFDDNITPRALAGIAVGDRIEVSGFPDAAGAVVASYVEKKPAAGAFEITGPVSNLNAGASTFSINALTVDYSAATVSNGTLAAGATVEVKGSTLLASGALRATSVEVKTGLGARSGDQLELEGYLTRFGSTADFDINGQRVATDSATRFELNGLPLALNAKVEAEGSVNSAGTLVARKVEVKRDASTRIVATIESLSAPATLRLLGVTVTVDAGTQYEDKAANPVRTLTFAALRVGDYLEVRGVEGATAGSMTAVQLERDDLETRRELRAIARSPAEPNVTLLGQTVNLSGTTQFRDAADQPISRAQFFSAIAGGNRLISLAGTASGATVSWREAELEN